MDKEDMQPWITLEERRRRVGLAGGLGHNLKECNQQLAESIIDIMECSLITGKVQTDWKTADVILISEEVMRIHQI